MTKPVATSGASSFEETYALAQASKAAWAARGAADDAVGASRLRSVDPALLRVLTDDELAAAARGEPPRKSGGKPKSIANSIQAIDYGPFMKLTLPERAPLLAPWCMEQSLNMVHGWRGTGKTHFAIGAAWAIATGLAFLGWEAPDPRRVLYVDGELPASVVQARLRDVHRRTGTTPAAGYFRIITPDILGRASPDLAVTHDQDELDELVGDAKLIVLDNLSALIRSGAAENDAESWVTVSDWALRHRSAGRSILFVHHSGKNGAQRGTSRREDLLDVVIGLRKPQEYDARDGARFEVHFEKGRHMTGDQLTPFEAALDDNVSGGWTIKSCEGSVDLAIVERLGLGLSQSEIARELKIDRSNVSRRVQSLRQSGALPAEGEKVRNKQRNKDQKGLV